MAGRRGWGVGGGGGLRAARGGIGGRLGHEHPAPTPHPPTPPRATRKRRERERESERALNFAGTLARTKSRISHKFERRYVDLGQRPVTISCSSPKCHEFLGILDAMP